MSLMQTLQVFEALDSIHASANTIKDIFKKFKNIEIKTKTIKGEKGSTDFVRLLIPGSNGKSKKGSALTMGIIGRLGGIGARPKRIGMVSDADGAVAAIASALKLAQMQENGDTLPGDVIVTTHICPTAPTRPHEPVDFMDSPVSMDAINEYEVDKAMDAILSIDTTKGNRIINHKGFAISPTVREGYILRISEDLLRIMEMTTGKLPVTFAITTQDITPYGNNLYHLNSILQPATATKSPVVGVAITAESMVPCCGTGASHEIDISAAVKFAVEVAKEFTRGTCQFYNSKEFLLMQKLYGSLSFLQKPSK